MVESLDLDEPGPLIDDNRTAVERGDLECEQFRGETLSRELQTGVEKRRARSREAALRESATLNCLTQPALGGIGPGPTDVRSASANATHEIGVTVAAIGLVLHGCPRGAVQLAAAGCVALPDRGDYAVGLGSLPAGPDPPAPPTGRRPAAACMQLQKRRAGRGGSATMRRISLVVRRV